VIHLAYATAPGNGRTLGARLRRRVVQAAQGRGLQPSLVGRRDAVDVRGWPERAPVTITARLYQALRARAPTRLYDWTERVEVPAGPGDVLLGHPFPGDDARAWNRACLAGTAGVRIALLPLSHRMAEANAFLDPYVPRLDAILGIMGPYWWETWREGPFAHWADKITPVDMAIDVARFPRVKRGFNPPGKRTFLYLGGEGPQKGTHLLSILFGQARGHRCVWVGTGRGLPHVEHRGFAELTPGYLRRLAEECDVVVTMGVSDANPTTILEAMAWGFPVCATPESGYHRTPELTLLSTTDMAHNLRVLERMQEAPEAELLALADGARRRVEAEYGWDRFLATVLGGVERAARARGVEPWPA
jgi:glycosyltransferase involved in cell wall biosynthesis